MTTEQVKLLTATVTRQETEIAELRNQLDNPIIELGDINDLMNVLPEGSSIDVLIARRGTVKKGDVVVHGKAMSWLPLPPEDKK